MKKIFLLVLLIVMLVAISGCEDKYKDKVIYTAKIVDIKIVPTVLACGTTWTLDNGAVVKPYSVKNTNNLRDYICKIGDTVSFIKRTNITIRSQFFNGQYSEYFRKEKDKEIKIPKTGVIMIDHGIVN